jgi:hypothetical protein
MTMPRTAYALLIALIATATNIGAQGPPLEIKGVPIGASMDELQAKIPGFTCAASGCILLVSSYVSKQCGSGASSNCLLKAWEPLKFGPAFPKYYRAEFKDGKLARVSVTIDQGLAGQVIIALTEKYGKPSTDDVKSIQNRAGATFDNRVATWVRDDGEIKVEQRSGSINDGDVTISAKGYNEAATKEIVDKAKASAKGL